ncbi:MAG: DegV family protein [Thermomicrobiaceae bacterium]
MNTSSRPVHIVTDSTADLTEITIGDLPVTVVPLSVDINGTVYRDAVDLTREEFVTHIRKGAFPKTSQPSPGAFQEVYRPLLDAGYDIVSVHIARQLSGTFNSATQAASAVDDGRIWLIDSTTVSMGTGFQAIEAAEMARDGRSAEEIHAFIEKRKHDQRLYATLETLEFLRKGGRIGRAAAMLGSALRLKPIVRVHDGAVEPVERVRTYRRALNRLAGIYEESQPFDRIAVLHLDASEEAEKLVKRVLEIQPDADVVTGNIGTVIGAYGGPGLVGFTGLVSSNNSVHTG